MSIEIGIVYTTITLILAVAGFYIGQKKSSKDDGMTLGQFIGEMRTEIASIKEMINELKSDHKEVDGKIKDAIAEHVKVYHKWGGYYG